MEMPGGMVVVLFCLATTKRGERGFNSAMSFERGDSLKS